MNSAQQREFQFTRPRGARLFLLINAIDTSKFQFTRPRGARRERIRPLEVHVRFNSRAREGRDSAAARLASDWPCFNSRAREGRDADGEDERHVRAGVSIHAPARGATPWPSPPRPRRRRFNSRAREGRDTAMRQTCVLSTVFQFTRPRGARRLRRQIAAKPRQFQFTRPRGARRRRKDWISRMRLVSIHAPARGATEAPNMILDGWFVSIHAPARGATSFSRTSSMCPGVFQFTRPRGARRRRSGASSSAPRFNSRAREGRDLDAPPRPVRQRHVSIHAPARGATTARL